MKLNLPEIFECFDMKQESTGKQDPLSEIQRRDPET